MKTLLLICLVAALLVTTNASNGQKRCDNPMNSNLNEYQTSSYIRTSENLKNAPFCSNQNNKSSCCTKKMTEELQFAYEKFKVEFSVQNALEMVIIDQNIRQILIHRENSQESIPAYNQALENIDTTQTAIETLRDNMPQSDEVEHTLDISDDGTEFSMTVDDVEYSFTGVEIEDYFIENNDMIRDALDVIDSTLKSLVDLEMFKESPMFIREKKGDHHSIRIDEEIFKQEFQESQERIRRNIPARQKCFSKVMEHFGAVRCLGCEVEWAQWGIELDLFKNSNVVLNLNTNVCTELMEYCSDYIDSQEEMNANAVLYVFAVSSSNMLETGALPEDGDFGSIDEAEEEIAFLTQMNAEFLANIPDTQFFARPNECEGLDNKDCQYLCKNFIHSLGVSQNAIFKDNIEESADLLMENLNDFEELFDDDGESRRILTQELKQSSDEMMRIINEIGTLLKLDSTLIKKSQLKQQKKTLNQLKNLQKTNISRILEEEQEDPIDKYDSKNLFYRQGNSLNTFEYSKNIQANFTVPGDSGVRIFNYTGENDYDDLFLNPTVIDGNTQSSNMLGLNLVLLIVCYMLMAN